MEKNNRGPRFNRQYRYGHDGWQSKYSMHTRGKKATAAVISEFSCVFKHDGVFYIYAMDSPSPAVIPQVQLKKHKGLHDNDSRFVEEVIKVVSSLDGSSSMRLKLFTKFPTRYSIILCNPPRMTLDDMNQILMMNAKITSLKVDLETSELKIESYKHNEDTQRKRKRSIAFDDMDIPSEYDLSMVDKKDRKHIEGIMRNVLGMTTMEFSSEIKPSASYYDLELKDIEALNVEIITEIVNRYRAFITDTIFDYPQKSFSMKIRRNDTPITQIRQNIVPRKKLKLR